MKPNLSALAAFARIAFLVFVGAFLGALVLPAASNGALPLTWSAWKPVLSIALGVAMAAELLWLRTHMKQALDAAGVSLPTSTPANDVAAKRGFTRVSLVAALGLVALVVGGIGASCAQPAKTVNTVDTTTVIPLTNAVCAVAPDSPIGQPYVDVICSILQGTEQIVATVSSAIAAGGAETTTTTAPILSVRLRIPATSASAFLAAHKGK